jgi:hypothetical protein
VAARVSPETAGPSVLKRREYSSWENFTQRALVTSAFQKAEVFCCPDNRKQFHPFEMAAGTVNWHIESQRLHALGGQRHSRLARTPPALMTPRHFSIQRKKIPASLRSGDFYMPCGLRS